MPRHTAPGSDPENSADTAAQIYRYQRELFYRRRNETNRAHGRAKRTDENRVERAISAQHNFLCMWSVVVVRIHLIPRCTRSGRSLPAELSAYTVQDELRFALIPRLDSGAIFRESRMHFELERRAGRRCSVFMIEAMLDSDSARNAQFSLHPFVFHARAKHLLERFRGNTKRRCSD